MVGIGVIGVADTTAGFTVEGLAEGAAVAAALAGGFTAAAAVLLLTAACGCC